MFATPVEPNAPPGESFIQRQKRLAPGLTVTPQAPQTPGQPAAPNGAGALPVGASDFGNGMVKFADGQVLPRNHPAYAAKTATPPQAFGTPVSGDGKIPPPAAGAPAFTAPPAAPAAPTTPPAAAPSWNPATAPLIKPESLGVDSNKLNPGTPVTGQPGAVWQHNGHGWVIQPAGTTSGGGGGTPAAPAVVPGAVKGPTALFNEPAPALAPLPAAYEGTPITQYQAPQHNVQNQQQLDLISKLLQNPETLSPQVVNQMKQKAAEDSILMQQQLQQVNDDEMSARGFSSSGGMAQAQQRRSAENMQKAILGSNRDLDINAVSQNRADTLGALGTAEDILGGQNSRNTANYGATLAGQTTQAGDRQAVSQSGINRAITQFTGGMDSYNAGQNQQQANRDDYWKGQGLDLQKTLGQSGLSNDTARINNQATQFGQNHGLNILQFLEGQRVSDNSNGLNWAQLGQQGQQQLIAQIMAGLR